MKKIIYAVLIFFGFVAGAYLGFEEYQKYEKEEVERIQQLINDTEKMFSNHVLPFSKIVFDTAYASGDRKALEEYFSKHLVLSSDQEAPIIRITRIPHDEDEMYMKTWCYEFGWRLDSVKTIKDIPPLDLYLVGTIKDSFDYTYCTMLVFINVLYMVEKNRETMERILHNRVITCK